MGNKSVLVFFFCLVYYWKRTFGNFLKYFLMSIWVGRYYCFLQDVFHTRNCEINLWCHVDDWRSGRIMTTEEAGMNNKLYIIFIWMNKIQMLKKHWGYWNWILITVKFCCKFFWAQTLPLFKQFVFAHAHVTAKQIMKYGFSWKIR